MTPLVPALSTMPSLAGGPEIEFGYNVRRALIADIIVRTTGGVSDDLLDRTSHSNMSKADHPFAFDARLWRRQMDDEIRRKILTLLDPTLVSPTAIWKMLLGRNGAYSSRPDQAFQ